MITTNNIAILLATYNGERYLKEQLNSLLQQTLTNWDLYIHDDGSEDSTIDIVKEFAKQDDRIHLLEYPSTGGACNNFMSLLQQVEAPYYMFCDQDDVWMSNKIEMEFQRMQELEKTHNNVPIVVITDLQIVDAKLSPICPSFNQYENIHPERIHSWYHFAKGNIATGCTMLFNRQAKLNTLPVSKYTLMHDSWITLCTAARDGIISYIDQPSILYRQHGSNTVGAQDAGRFTLIYRLNHFREMIKANLVNFHQMNSIRPISLCQYAYQKLRK